MDQETLRTLLNAAVAVGSQFSILSLVPIVSRLIEYSKSLWKLVWSDDMPLPIIYLLVFAIGFIVSSFMSFVTGVPFAISIAAGLYIGYRTCIYYDNNLKKPSVAVIDTQKDIVTELENKPEYAVVSSISKPETSNLMDGSIVIEKKTTPPAI